MKFDVIDPKTGSNILGGLVNEGCAQLVVALPVDSTYPDYKQLEVGQSGVYEFTLCGTRTVAEIKRVE